MHAFPYHILLAPIRARIGLQGNSLRPAWGVLTVSIAGIQLTFFWVHLFESVFFALTYWFFLVREYLVLMSMSCRYGRVQDALIGRSLINLCTRHSKRAG